jgi:hypothetical protein
MEEVYVFYKQKLETGNAEGIDGYPIRFMLRRKAWVQ